MQQFQMPHGSPQFHASNPIDNINSSLTMNNNNFVYANLSHIPMSNPGLPMQMPFPFETSHNYLATTFSPSAQDPNISNTSNLNSIHNSTNVPSCTNSMNEIPPNTTINSHQTNPNNTAPPNRNLRQHPITQIPLSPSSSPSLAPREHNSTRTTTRTVFRQTTVVAFDHSEEDTSVSSESPAEAIPSGKESTVFRKVMILIWKNNQSLGTIFFLGFAKESLLSWFPSFLEEVYNCPPDSTIYVITSCGLTLASMFGAVIVGIISDKLFGSRRNPVYILCAALYTTSFVILAFAPNAISACILLCFGGVWLLGSFSLVAFSAALDLNDKNTSASASDTKNEGMK